ncbi:hypothetical protein GCM10029963_33130 [Micromonospora andamanensis]
MAGGAQCHRELLREQVDLGCQVEAALAVDDDVFDERAGAGRFAGAVDLYSALPVVGGQGVYEGGLPAACVPSIPMRTQSRTLIRVPCG